jgi:DNA-directed RNA polymerase specialized sigma24 family protein
MEQGYRAGALFTGPRAKPGFAAVKTDPPQRETDKYTTLLYKIASSFGFGRDKAGELVQAAYASARSHQADQGSLPYREWLVRILVHQCVVGISSELFGQTGGPIEKKHPGLLDDYYHYRATGMQYLQQMPLSFRVVYILRDFIGFTAPEIAAIINAPLFTVKERYYKAQAFLLAHR